MSRRYLWPLTVIVALILGAMSQRAFAAAPAGASLVKMAPAQTLVTAQGMTLYLFTPDKRNASVCAGQCAAYWPPLLLPKGTSALPALPGVSGTFGVALRADGSRQLTYNGSPLYTFIKDKKPGDMKGEGAEKVWWAVVVSGASSVTVVPGGDRHEGQGHHGQATPTATAPQTTPTTTAPGGYYHGSRGGDG